MVTRLTQLWRIVAAGATLLVPTISLAQYNPRALVEPQAAMPVTEPDGFESQWPIEVPGASGQITIFQPQMEELVGDTLTARSAVSIARPNGAEAVYGVVWFKGRISTDRVSRIVQVHDVTITQTRIPEADPAAEQAVREAISRGMAAQQAPLSLDQLLEMLESKQPAQAALQFSPPKILFVDHPAIKVQYDGDPKLIQANNSALQRVVNTPFFVVYDPQTKSYFLKGGGVWYEAIDAMGPFRRSSRVPQEAITLADQSGYKDPENPFPAAQLERLEIITATEPTELIWTDGPPQFGSVPGTSLLYVRNTDANVFMTVASQQTYLLLSGRWYEAPNRNGPWTFVPPANLPAEFAKIPTASERGEVLAHVAGTPQAKQAVADTLVPQTAAVDRKNFEQPKVAYDGDPFFEPVQGTSLNYAANSPQSVVQVDNKYYLCSNAVWYVSASPQGPWDLCTDVPAAVYDIPASSPIYPVSYVRTYGYTDDYVYYGYTPGYLGTYAYDGAVVYGTGYRYNPWYGNYYYPRAYTYGFGASYDCDSNSWGFGIGYGSGGGSIWFGYGSGGYYGCDPWFGYGGYYPCSYYGYRGYPYRYNYLHHNDHHDRHDGHHSNSNEARARNNRDDDRDSRERRFNNQRNASSGDVNSGVNSRSANVYDRRSDVRRADASTARDGVRSPGQPRLGRENRTEQQNNVLADREGRVFRRTDDGDWQVRDSGNWRSQGRTPAALANEPVARQVAARQTSRSTDARANNPGTPRVRPEDRADSSPTDPRAGRSAPVDRQAAANRPRTFAIPPVRSQQRATETPSVRNNPNTRVAPPRTDTRSARSQENNIGRGSPGQPPLAAPPEVRRDTRSSSPDRTNAGGQGNRGARVAPPRPAPREAVREAPREVRSRPDVESRTPSVQRSDPPPRSSDSARSAPRSEPSRVRSAPPPSRPSRSDSPSGRGGGNSGGRTR